MHPVCLGVDWGAGSGDEVLHSVFNGGAAEGGHCDCWEFGEKVAKFVLGQGDGIQGGVDCAQSEGAASEAYRGEGLRVDEAAATDIYKKAGVIEKICVKERALDLSDEEDLGVGLLAEGEGEAPHAKSLD